MDGLLTVNLRTVKPTLPVTTAHVVVTPGETITTEGGYIRGHGTYTADGRLVASVAGVVERVNKLISVRPLKFRYTAQVGDVVVGRISEVGQKRWKVNIGALQDAILQLTSITLPAAQQRRRTHQDSLNMRAFYKESDLISSEVQNVHASDHSVQLHTRSLKYGKLENGQLVIVPPALIKRLKQHFVKLPCGVDAILGNNGYIFLTVRPEEVTHDDEDAPLAETLIRRNKLHAEMEITAIAREKIAKVHNSIKILSSLYVSISPINIMAIYDASTDIQLDAKHMLDPGLFEKFMHALQKKTISAE